MVKKVVLFFLLLLLPSVAGAQRERVLSFESVVAVQKDAVVRVRETIRVYVHSGEMRYGLHRDFPVHYADADGQKHDVSLVVHSVQRDGVDEPHTIERTSGIMRLSLGNENTPLPVGIHTYTITYDTDGHIRFLEDTDELQWNVTGDRWEYATDTVRATVLLPDSVREVQSLAYLLNSDGAIREQGMVDSAGYVVFMPLETQEQVVLQSSWRKGIVAEMREAKQRSLFWKNNIEYVVGGIGILLVFVWFFTFWLLGYRQDESAIAARSAIPKGLSPAAVRVLNRMGYDHKTMATAVVSMAIKGALSIEHKAGQKMLLRKSATEGNALAADEDLLLKVLFARSDTVVLHTEQQEHVRHCEKTLQSILQRQCEPAYFHTNTRAFWGGIALSCTVVGSMLFLGFVLDDIPFRIVPFALVLVVLAVLNVWFYRMVRVPTARGRVVRDEIEGLRQFIMGEKEEGKDAMPMTMELFEQYLPYAVALDVEQVWGQSLAAVGEQRTRGFGATSKGKASYVYNPPWYSGLRYADMQAFSRAVETALANSTAEPTAIADY